MMGRAPNLFFASAQATTHQAVEQTAMVGMAGTPLAE